MLRCEGMGESPLQRMQQEDFMTRFAMPRRSFAFGKLSLAILLAGFLTVAASTPSSAQWVNAGDAYVAAAWRGNLFVPPPFYWPRYGAYVNAPVYAPVYAPRRASRGGYVNPWYRGYAFEEPGF
jgi:hypothetical protein